MHFRIWKFAALATLVMTGCHDMASNSGDDADPDTGGTEIEVGGDADTDSGGYGLGYCDLPCASGDYLEDK
ncbi:MAG: hypothetical protein GY854_06720 [Deltaproteobacteria bacterium]|nr:hypothetical protein [Deltaproteobacteria bacterium]